MKVHELVELFQKLPPDARVVFDTEATEWRTHYVAVDYCHFEDGCVDAVVLSTNRPHGE